MIKRHTCMLAFVFAAAAEPAFCAQLTRSDDSALVWQSDSGRMIRFRNPQITVKAPDRQPGIPLDVVLKHQENAKDNAVLEYRCEYGGEGSRISGSMVINVSLPTEPGEDAILVKTLLAFEDAVTADTEVVFAFDVTGDPATRIGLPERDGHFKIWPMSADGGAGRFELGQAAKGPLACSQLGMPVVGLVFDGKSETDIGTVQQLAVATDPYCGSYIQAHAVADAGAPSTRVSVRTTYSGSIIPLRSERRTLALEFHRNGIDRTLRGFYRTIPEIQPGAGWTHGIHLVYYDYLSEKGEGWFKDLKVLADKIPPKQRGHVAVCMHGWYDYFQRYAYDHEKGRLLEEWTAFPGTFKIPMSLEETHRRIKFAKDLGFRVLMYFADGTNSDSGAPNFREEYVLKNKDGGTFPGWKGPDSLGNPLKMDPSVPGLRDWYRGYLKALLAEYAGDVDGFVWDETFYIDTNFISYPGGVAAYADRAMMSLVSELTQLAQEYRKKNPDLVFLASDIGYTSYALVANGTFQDSATEEKHWGPSMFANYRNCLWSCNWYPLRLAAENQIAAEKYGLPQGVSNGWGDNCGPSRMPPELLDAVVKRFVRNVESKRQRVRFLAP